MSKENRVRKFGRYSLVSIALLGTIASTAVLNAPAYAGAPTELSCGNAPKPGAEFLTDTCAWANLRASEQMEPWNNAASPTSQDHQDGGAGEAIHPAHSGL
jgi:hypothetical protein